MNSLWFFFNDDDRTIECRYYEDYYSNGNYIRLNMSQEKFKKYFDHFFENYEMKDVISKEAVIHKFFDVDIYKVDEMIKESRRYNNPRESDFITFKDKNEQPPDIVNIFEFESDEVEPRRASRSNKFTKSVVIASAALLTTLSAFTLKNIEVKKSNDSINNIYSIEESISSDSKDSGLLFEDKTYESKIEESTLPQDDGFIDENSVDEVSDEVKIVDDVQSNMQVVNPNYIIVLNTENDADCEKAFVTEQFYGQAILDEAKNYGIDYNVLRAIGTHERGIHSEVVDAGGGIGLFQIQISGNYSWIGNTVRAYNFTTGEWETEKITYENASDIFGNIKIGAMIFQECLRNNNYDVAKAVTEYNYGSPNLGSVLNKYKTYENPSYNNDPNDLNWLGYRGTITGGDPNYLENVFKYIKSGSIITFYTPNGECINIQYDNLNMTKRA